MSAIISLKNVAIVYCRLSRVPDASRSILSLESQEYAIKQFLLVRGWGVYLTLKNIGSAYSKPQTDLKAILRGSKGKILVVADPSRLSRSVANFEQIWKICVSNKHSIAIVTTDRVYNFGVDADYYALLELVTNTERESREMGQKISRTMRYKKSREAPWGSRRDERDDRIVPDNLEINTTRLIKLLGTPGTRVSEIRRLIEECGNMEGKEPFELVEYGMEVVDTIPNRYPSGAVAAWNSLGRHQEVFKVTDLKSTTLPYAMSVENIVDTLSIYEVRRRRRKFNRNDVSEILANHPVAVSQISGDDLSEDFERMEVEEERKEQEPAPVPQVEWINIWYDPAFGLPPNVILPIGFELPKSPCTIMIPKM